MRRFFAPAENFRPTRVSFGMDETRHLRDVLRLEIGDEVSVFDGEGREFRCRLREINKKSAELEIIEETVSASPESSLDLTLAVTMLKGEKFDLVIQKAVELGVTRFVPLITMRCNVKFKDSQKRLERWRKIILEASKQSGRAKLMSIAEPVEFKQFLIDRASEDCVLFSERGGRRFSTMKKAKKITALVGPEGGWDNSELDFAEANRVLVVTLGGRVLRAETAAIAMAAILQYRFGDLN